MLFKNVKVLNGAGEFQRADVAVSGERISQVIWYGENHEFQEDSQNEFAGKYLIPGLCDIHFHGGVGYDFCDGTEEAIRALADYNASNGILEMCPATMTYTEEILTPIMQAAAKHKNERGADLVGINMEGPFISPDKVGAQNPEYVLRPDYQMLQRLDDAANGLVKLVDVAPEVDGCLDFIRKASAKYKISIAHTCTDYDTAMRAFEAGAAHLTHTFNAMNGIHHREPGPIAAARDAKAEVELISDGHHVHPAVMRMLYGMMPIDKVILIDDCCRATGGEEGREYDLGGQMVVAHDGVAYLADNPTTIAASATNMMDCFKFSVLEAGISLESAVQAATINPCKSIGIDTDYGSIAPGKVANMLLLDENLEILQIILHGSLFK